MRLIKIMSDKVQIKSDSEEFKDIRINNLISIADKSVEVITVVTSISDNDADMPVLGVEDYIFPNTSIKVLECSIIGSIKDGKFSRAIDVYPSTNITAKEVAAEEFENMLNVDENKGFCIGNYVEYGCPAWVDGNKFFQRHACIVGNTGSGKSETVAKILEEASKLPGSNLIVFDIHGEYSKLSYARNIEVSSFGFPAWLFGFNGFVTNILGVKEDSTTIMSALRQCYYGQNPKGNEGKPIYFDSEIFLKNLISLNEEEVRTGEIYKTGTKAGLPKTVKGDFNGKLSSVISSLKDKFSDSRYKFLFKESEQSYLNYLVAQIMENDKPVKNIDLSNVPHDIAIAIIGVITQLVFEVQKNQDRENIPPVTLVCDEAHVYIPTNMQLSASQQRMVTVFENIAKEGRKFGITLFPASQRPSELNRTIMAQCGNFIVGKLNNENDKTMIKGLLPDGSSALIDSTTTFFPGEVLIVGDAAPIPLKIKVQLANERPQSRTIEFWDTWKKESFADGFGEALERYMED